MSQKIIVYDNNTIEIYFRGIESSISLMDMFWNEYYPTGKLWLKNVFSTWVEGFYDYPMLVSLLISHSRQYTHLPSNIIRCSSLTYSDLKRVSTKKSVRTLNSLAGISASAKRINDFYFTFYHF